MTPPAAAQAVGFSDVVVFHFSDANSYATAGDYSAVITWGDGTTATVTSTASGDGQIVADGGGFDVLGSHVYTQQLSDATFSVQVTDVGGSSTGASQSGFSVADAPLTAGSLTPPAATEGIGFSDALLFQFADADPGATAGEYTALITWGDGTTATVTSTASGDGQIVADGDGFDVLGSHVYTQQVSGATFSVQVTDVGGSTTGASQSGFSVADQPLLATGAVNVSFEQGQAIDPQTVVATFTDPGGAQAVDNYSASIDWGDGTAASQGVLSLADGVFTVEGGHTYAADSLGSPYTVVVSIVHNAMPAVTATDTASITGPHTMAWVASGSGDWASSNWENLPPSCPDATIDVQVNASAVITVTADEAANSLTLSNGATIVIEPGASLTVTGSVTLSSAATVDVESGGTLVLSGLADGSGAAGVTLDGGTLEATGGFTSAVPIVIGAGGGTVDTNGYDVTLDGSLSGDSTSTLIKMGAGTLTLSGSSIYKGGTSVEAGALVATSPSACPTATCPSAAAASWSWAVRPRPAPPRRPRQPLRRPLRLPVRGRRALTARLIAELRARFERRIDQHGKRCDRCCAGRRHDNCRGGRAGCRRTCGQRRRVVRCDRRHDDSAARPGNHCGNRADCRYGDDQPRFRDDGLQCRRAGSCRPGRCRFFRGNGSLLPGGSRLRLACRGAFEHLGGIDHREHQRRRRYGVGRPCSRPQLRPAIERRGVIRERRIGRSRRIGSRSRASRIRPRRPARSKRSWTRP